jgi:hypothetical protein
MKKISLIILGFLLITGSSFSQDKPKSPPREIFGKSGATTIQINYSSPSVRGREIYGDLVPWDKLWRAGANAATTISFSQDVTVNGDQIKKGVYSFFVTPKEEGYWFITFNSEAEQWGAYKHKEKNDVLVTAATTTPIGFTEQLTYSVEDGNIYLDWAKTRLEFKVK